MRKFLNLFKETFISSLIHVLFLHKSTGTLYKIHIVTCYSYISFRIFVLQGDRIYYFFIHFVVVIVFVIKSSLKNMKSKIKSHFECDLIYMLNWHVLSIYSNQFYMLLIRIKYIIDNFLVLHFYFLQNLYSIVSGSGFSDRLKQTVQIVQSTGDCYHNPKHQICVIHPHHYNSPCHVSI